MTSCNPRGSLTADDLLAIAYKMRYVDQVPASRDNIPGPDGNRWRVAIYKRSANGSLQMCAYVHGNGKPRFNSFKTLKEYCSRFREEDHEANVFSAPLRATLVEEEEEDGSFSAEEWATFLCLDKEEEEMEKNEETSFSIDTPASLLRAHAAISIFIRIVARAFAKRTKTLQSAALEAGTGASSLLATLQDCQSKIDSVKRVTEKVVRIKDGLAKGITLSTSKIVLSSVLPGEDPLQLVTSFSSCSKKEVSRYASARVRDNVDACVVKCAHSVLSSSSKNRYPLLLSPLPFPTGRPFRVLDFQGKAWTIVDTGSLLSKQHSSALTARFADEGWCLYLEEMLRGREDAICYDAFDASDGSYGGSCVLTKFLSVWNGSHVPVVVVESIASLKDGSGAGGALFRFAKKLSFSDPIPDSTPPCFSLVAAMCATESPFWAHKLSEGPIAHSIFLQLHKQYHSSCGYQIVPDCDYMSEIVFRDEL